MLDTDSWQRVENLFGKALGLPSEEREVFLDEVCDGDDALRAEIESLLASYEKSDAFLESIDAEQAEKLVMEVSPLEPRDGERLGPWKIVRELGRGGMGVVYLAERADGQFEQRVALKLVKRGMDSDAILERFLNERQVLATLRHQHIARFFDGGVTDEGQPYFAMEYVEGVPITDYCDAHGLSIDERLALFEKVCRAVEHAHNRLIIHRDLKPSNILVTENGNPRLLDFGLAKVLQDPTGDPATTRREQRWLTLEYASPEQVKGESVGTPSDTYQLGLVLYEMFTGKRAYSLKSLSSTAAERVICEDVPPKPSTTIVSGGTDVSTQVPPEKLRKRLKGDLDIIVMKALHKDPQRGYASAETLANDIDRHLKGLPIQARLDTTSYRVKKFVRRHRWGVAAAAAVMLSLVAGLGVALWQAHEAGVERDRAEQEAAKAERVSTFLTDVFQAADPFSQQGSDVKARTLLEAGAEQIRNEFADEPEVRAELLETIGFVYLQYYETDRAEPLVTEALELRRRSHPEGHPDLAKALSDYATLLHRQGNLEGAERVAREALEMRRGLLGENHEDVAWSVGQVGVVLADAGHVTEAEPFLREALAIHRRIGSDSGDRATGIMNILARTLTAMGNYAEAETIYRQAQSLRARIFPPDSPAMATIPHNLGVNLMHQGRLAEAEKFLRGALELRRAGHPEGHYRITSDLVALGRVLRRRGEMEEAYALTREALELRRRFQPGGRHGIVECLRLLSLLAGDRGDHEEEQLLIAEFQALVDTSADPGQRMAQPKDN